ncbi:MAG: M24 family metallopeptidase [Muricomes sp.]
METVKRIREWMRQKSYDGVILGRRDSYAWISQGAENHVVTNSPQGVAYYVITQDCIRLVADNSDAARMNAEQNTLQGTLIEVPWYESVEQKLKEMASEGTFVSDTGIAGTPNVLEDLIALRMVLSEEEKSRYKQIGRECAEIVENVCLNAKPGQTEKEIAARLKGMCFEKGISPDCVLVGADSRILSYRHPLPTDKPVEKSLLVVLGGEKYGLNISMTRIVYFDDIPEEIEERYKKTQYIFACMQTMMKEGLSYGEYFERVKGLYRDAGWEDEWKSHHQGGPTGYQCREWIALPGMSAVMHENQAYAWNPTILGTKCEETTILEDGKIITLTDTQNWPRISVSTPYGNYAVAKLLKI